VDVGDYISPLAFGMAVDKVADVRHAAIKAVEFYLMNLILYEFVNFSYPVVIRNLVVKKPKFKLKYI
jgi:hypothetical protein